MSLENVKPLRDLEPGDPDRLVLSLLCAAMTKAQMRRTLVIAGLALTVTSIAIAQKQSASRDQRSGVEQAIRELDKERIQAQIDAEEHRPHPDETVLAQLKKAKLKVKDVILGH